MAQETIWFWDQSSGSYKQVNQATALSEGVRYIAPGQGFFVESNGTGGSFVFPEAMQSHQSTDVFSRSSSPSVPKINLQIESGDAQRTADVFYLASATKGWDNGFDSTIFSGASTSFEVYTHLVSDSQGENLGLQSLPNQDYPMMVVPVGINAGSGKTNDISAEVSGFPTGIEVYLEDKQENTFTKLSEPGTT